MPTILLIDDDPSQLKLYTWILERGSFAVVQALVGSTSVDLPDPANVSVDVVPLDYRLSSQLTPADIADLVRAKFPNAPHNRALRTSFYARSDKSVRPWVRAKRRARKAA